MNIGFLQEGLLLSRRKRFFADVSLPSGVVTAHCANTGSMRSLLEPGTRALIAYVASPRRSLDWSLRLLRLPDGTLACVDTSLSNPIVAEALEQNVLPDIPSGSRIDPEVVAEPGSRIDFRVTSPTGTHIWIEVKNVTLCESSLPGVAQFPDAVSTRGFKHLQTLSRMCAQGDRAIILYLVNRTGMNRFEPASHIDPAYARGLEEARHAGVEIYVCHTRIESSPSGWTVTLADTHVGLSL